jgi:hypothetical protein
VIGGGLAGPCALLRTVEKERISSMAPDPKLWVGGPGANATRAPSM